jgi:hypothetical protein
MGIETDDTVRLRGPRRGERSWAARFLPWVGGAALVAVLATGAAWWSLRPVPPVQQARLPAPAIVAAPPPAPPAFAPPLASEAEILADQPTQIAVYRFAPQPAVVVLQFPSLGEQALMLNRAAALIEKNGFPRDRVMPRAALDARIAAGGGTPDTFYYGHDYRAADLVRFLRLATDLDGQEQALQSLVQKLGWQEQGAAGALISLVRQSSAPDLDATARATILRHELSHGVYFTDPAYAAYCQRFWSDVLTSEERAKFTAFLGREGYDTTLSDLIVNETQAYLVHTPDKRFFNANEIDVSEARVAELRRIFVAGMPPGWLRDSTRQPLGELVPAKAP